jgi:hypothetical protein
MDMWLDQEDFDTLINQINNVPTATREHDANWAALLREKNQKNRYNTDAVVKTQTPTLLKFEKNYSFVYRRFDGAQWHTELREVDTEYRCHGFTEKQKRLKENVDYILSHSGFNYSAKWITPVIKKTNQLDPAYQLIQIGDSWLCCINNSIYENSSYRHQPTRSYAELTFSTKAKPLFTLESTETILDKLIRKGL